MVALGALASAGAAEISWRQAPAPAAQAINQRALSGNACGPAALLNACRFGSATWSVLPAALEAADDRAQLTSLIRRYGVRPSQHLPNRPRWSRHGINIADLTDLANEFAADASSGRKPPPLRHEILVLREGESPALLLRRCHRLLHDSLQRGFPPVLSIRSHRLGAEGWKPLDAHFVTILAVPRKLERGADRFVFRCVDPWGAVRREGRLLIPQSPLLAAAGRPPPCLETILPGLHIAPPSAQNPIRLTSAAILGRW
jgi:hypothetical protein